jgi:hypothetical protein
VFREAIWIVDAHSYGKRFIVRADEKLTAFVEIEAAIRRRSPSAALRYGVNGSMIFS